VCRAEEDGNKKLADDTVSTTTTNAAKFLEFVLEVLALETVGLQVFITKLSLRSSGLEK
jgi:hypothetical protein